MSGSDELTDEVFAGRGIDVMVYTSKQAEFDFQRRNLTDAQIRSIGTFLKTYPVLDSDRYVKGYRFRNVLDDKEVMFLFGHNGPSTEVLIAGLGDAGKLESMVSLLARAGSDAVFPGLNTLREGRRKKP